jgi:haloalkane dehalogenase
MRKTQILALGAILCLATSAIAPERTAAAEPKLPPPTIPETHAIPQSSVQVLGNRMTYLELGEGPPVVFLHGNPTSSYLWRNVMPHVAAGHRAIAPDLIGMGQSDKPDIAYTFADHYRFIEGFLDALGLERVTLVAHDWGAALAWEYARRNPDRVERLAFMEGVLPPAFPAPSFEALGDRAGTLFRTLKDPVEGPRFVIEQNGFVERILPNFVNRPLGEAAMQAYRAPFVDPEARTPVLAWPQQVPIAGEPSSTEAALRAIGAFMEETEMPVLMLYADPGALVPPAAVDWYIARIAKLETQYVGQGLHFIQEDRPEAIGRALADWLRRT